MHEGLAPSGRGYTDFHAGGNFALTEFSEVRMVPVRHRKGSLVPTVPSPDNTSGKYYGSHKSSPWDRSAGEHVRCAQGGYPGRRPCFGALWGAE